MPFAWIPAALLLVLGLSAPSGALTLLSQVRSVTVTPSAEIAGQPPVESSAAEAASDFGRFRPNLLRTAEVFVPGAPEPESAVAATGALQDSRIEQQGENLMVELVHGGGGGIAINRDLASTPTLRGEVAGASVFELVFELDRPLPYAYVATEATLSFPNEIVIAISTSLIGDSQGVIADSPTGVLDVAGVLQPDVYTLRADFTAAGELVSAGSDGSKETGSIVGQHTLQFVVAEPSRGALALAAAMFAWCGRQRGRCSVRSSAAAAADPSGCR